MKKILSNLQKTKFNSDLGTPIYFNFNIDLLCNQKKFNSYQLGVIIWKNLDANIGFCLFLKTFHFTEDFIAM